MLVSIYPKGLIDGFCLQKPTDGKAFNQGCRLLNLFAKNLDSVCAAIKENKIQAFDGLTASHNCQSLALRVVDICSDPEVREEVLAVQDRVKQVLESIKAAKNRGKGLSLAECTIEVSEELEFLCKAHLLELVCTKTIPRKTTYDPLIKEKLVKQEDLSKIESIIQEVRVAVANSLSQYMQQEAVDLDTKLLAPLSIVSEIEVLQGTILKVSSAFYTFKTALLKAKRDRIPVVVTEARQTKQEPFYLVYQAEGLESSFELMRDKKVLEQRRGQPCMMVESRIPQGLEVSLHQKIDDVGKDGLMELLLANAALSPQFGKTDHELVLLSEEERRAISDYRILGKSLGCDETDLRLLQVMHISPGALDVKKISDMGIEEMQSLTLSEGVAI